MAGLRFTVLLFAATSAAVLLAASAKTSSPSPRPPVVYVVGDEVGWAVPSGAGALNDWAATHRFLVGDVLDFKYSNPDSVLLVRRDDYERCSAASPVSRFADGGGGTRFTLGSPGLFYFISGAPARSEAGQRMAVRVVDALRRSLTSVATTPTPAPAPAPGTQPSDTPHRDLSLAQKQFAAAAIGFGAIFILIYFIVWLCVCCDG